MQRKQNISQLEKHVILYIENIEGTIIIKVILYTFTMRKVPKQKRIKLRQED